MNRHQQQATLTERDNSVQERLASMLRDTRRYEAEACDLMARWAGSFYETMASRSAVSAEELYERFPLRVRSSSRPGPDEALAARQRALDLRRKAFETWFEGSKVVDGEGRPLVVFHGTNQSFDRFDSARHGQNTRAASSIAFFFSESAAEAAEYAELAGRMQIADATSVEARVSEIRQRLARAEKAANWKEAERLTLEWEEAELGAIQAPPTGQNVLPVFLRAANPKSIDMGSTFDGHRVAAAIREALEEGFDSLRIINAYDPVGQREDGFATTQWVVFRPEQIKSALGNDGSFDRDDPSILSQAGLPHRSTQRTAIGLYSALARGVAALPAEQATAAGWKQAIKGLVNQGAIKAEEVEWCGIEEWLDLQDGLAGSSIEAERIAQGRMLSPAQRRRLESSPGLASRRLSKEHILGYLDRGGVLVEEVLLGSLREFGALGDEQLRKEYARIRGFEPEAYGEPMSREEILDELEGAPRGDLVDTKYSPYVLPGGQNYREVLLTLPAKRPPSIEDWATLNDVKLPGVLDPEYREIYGRYDAEKLRIERQSYRSNHWDQPNVLAHIRVNDRLDGDGKRVLFVEELQSDWGQEGKKKGFARRDDFEVRARTDGTFAIFQKSTGQSVTLRDGTVAFTTQEAAQAAIQGLQPSDAYGVKAAVPSAPFVTRTESWVALALKRIMVMAVEEGYDRVAFVSGEQSAQRYKLRKKIDAVAATLNPDGTYYVQMELGGDFVREEQRVPVERLPVLLGKDLAARVLAGQGDEEFRDGAPFKVLRGLDMSVGDSGMRGFYDQIVPATLKRLLSKFGGQPCEVKVNTAQDLSDTPADLLVRIHPTSDGRYRVGVGAGQSRIAETFDTAQEAQAWADEQLAVAAAGRLDVHLGFEVTDTLRQQVAQGLPLFSQDVRGTFDPRTLEIALGPKADASTWIHETGHFFLEAMTALASAPDAPKDIVEDMNRVLEWFGIESDPALPRRRTALETWLAMSTDERRPHHERWARAVEQYVMEGRAPNEDLEPLFKTFARWLCSLYTSVKEFLAMRTESTATPSGATASAPLPERPVLADGPAFLAWFGDSKVVDGEGRPLVVYHGTAQDFGAAAAFRASERGTFGAGIYFASPPEMASEWAIGHDGGRIMPVHLSITGPFHTRADYAVGEDCDVDSPAVPLIEAVFGHDSAAVIETLRNTEDGHLGESVRQRLMELGYDGIVATYSDGSREYIAFRPEQIKSALGNDGSFDRDDPSILSQGARASCHPELTDEIRRVMDRMLSIQHGRHAHEAEEAEREEGFPVEAMRMRA